MGYFEGVIAMSPKSAFVSTHSGSGVLCESLTADDAPPGSTETIAMNSGGNTHAGFDHAL
jgi:hypothetical protein